MFTPHPLSAVEAFNKTSVSEPKPFQFGGSRYRAETEVRFIFDGDKGEILSGNSADDLVNVYNVLIG